VDINATLLGQMVTFAIFVWFTMRFVWPPLNKALEERKTKIADGLAAAERGQRDWELTQDKITTELRQIKEERTKIIDHANSRGNEIIREAEEEARQEAARVVDLAQDDILRLKQHAKQDLRDEVATLAVMGAERIITKNMDDDANKQLIEAMIKEIDK